MKKLDLKGKQFGKLNVIKQIGITKYGKSLWLCRCDCGNKTIIIGSHLINGNTKSCGCYRKSGEYAIKHGHAKVGKETKIYRIWKAMNKRCNNPNDSAFKNYGKRKIKVCYLWSNKNPRGFQNFYKDVGNPPSGKSLDRINNNGNYEPNNWRWATNKEQMRNKRTNKLYNYKNKTWCLTDLAKENNLNPETLTRRLKSGMSLEDAITKPLQKRKTK